MPDKPKKEYWAIEIAGGVVSHFEGDLSRSRNMPKRRKPKKRKPAPAPMSEVFMEAVLEDGGPVLYVVFHGERIAKRYSGERWIILQPGYVVEGSQPGDDPYELVITYHPTKLPQ